MSDDNLLNSGWYHFVASSRHFYEKGWITNGQYQRLKDIAEKVEKEILG